MRFSPRAFLCISLVGLPGCWKTSTSGGAPSASPELEIQNEDFAKARGRFKTKLVRVGPSPQVEPEVSALPGATPVTYTSGPLQLRAYLWRAPGHRDRQPAVLFLHGGFGFGKEDWDMAQPFRDAGFMLMTPVLRGENGQPGNFTLFYDELDDVLAAADVLAKQPDVDASHLYVAGHSAGGTLTMLAAMASDRFRAAASFSGSVDQTIQENHLIVFDRSDIREFLLRSPLAYATSFKCPVRIYYGDQEEWARDESRRTAQLAKGRGLEAEAIEVPGAHESSVPEAIRQAIAFFRQKR